MPYYKTNTFPAVGKEVFTPIEGFGSDIPKLY